MTTGRIYSFGTGSFVTSATATDLPVTAPSGSAQADTVAVVADAQLRLFIPTGTSTFTLSNGTSAGTIGNPSCAGCTFTGSTFTTPGGDTAGNGTVSNPPTINFGSLAGTASGTDVVNAAVMSDDSKGWSLSAQISGQPPAGSGTVNLSLDEACTGCDPTSGGFTFTPASGINSFTTLSSSTSTPISSLGGTTTPSALHTIIPNVMNLQVALPAFNSEVAGTQTVTITYTLVAN